MSYRPDASISLVISADAQLQLGRGSNSILLPNASTTLSLVSGPAQVVQGTVSHATIATTNDTTKRYHANILSTTAVNSSCGVQIGALCFFRDAGFRLSATIGTAGTTAANQAAFWGLQSSNTSSFTSAFNPGTTNPITQVDCVGFGYEATETTLSFYYNDGSGNCSRIALGANFPVDAVSLYFIEIWGARGGSSINYKITRLNDGSTASGSVSTDLPTVTVGLSPKYYVANRSGAVSANVNLSFLGSVCLWGQ